jgi:hypothetical protein
LLNTYGLASLEDVFLKLCIEEEQGEKVKEEKNEVSIISKPDMYRLVYF